jgi:hypothetical protein
MWTTWVRGKPKGRVPSEHGRSACDLSAATRSTLGAVIPTGRERILYVHVLVPELSMARLFGVLCSTNQ